MPKPNLPMVAAEVVELFKKHDLNVFEAFGVLAALQGHFYKEVD